MVGNFDFLKGNIETIILNSLYSGDKYGYEITREIKEKTENRYEIKQPTLYGYLKKLQSQELIASYWGGESNGGRRRYYQLTEKGKELCIEYKSEWKFHKNVMESLVDSGDTEFPETKVLDKTSPILGSKIRQTKQRKENIVTREELNRINALFENTENTDMPKNNEKSDACEVKKTAATVCPASEALKKAIPSESFFAKNVREESQREKEYKSILDNLVGEQLNEKGKRVYENKTPEAGNPMPAPEEINHLELSETADAMAKQGLRMKLFNRVASIYKPAPFLPANKLNFLTFLFGALVVAVEMIIFWLCVRQTDFGKSTPFLIVIGVATVLLIVFGAIWLARPTKKVKPKFNQTFHIINSFIFFVVACIAVFVVDLLLLNLVFSDSRAVIMELVFPIVLLANVPVYVLINTAIKKQILKKI